MQIRYLHEQYYNKHCMKQTTLLIQYQARNVHWCIFPCIRNDFDVALWALFLKLKALKFFALSEWLYISPQGLEYNPHSYCNTTPSNFEGSKSKLFHGIQPPGRFHAIFCTFWICFTWLCWLSTLIICAPFILHGF